MRILRNFSWSYQDWTAGLYLRFARFVPETNDVPTLKVADIHTESAGWKIGNSQQNNCINVHVEGRVFSSESFISHSDPQAIGGRYFTTPFYGNSLKFTDVVDITYPQFFKFEEHTYSDGSRSTSMCCLVTVTVGEYFTMLDLTGGIKYDPDGHMISHTTEFHPSELYFGRMDSNGIPGNETRVVKKAYFDRSEWPVYSVDWLAQKFTVQSMFRIESIARFCRKCSTYSNNRHVEVVAVPAPTTSTGSYDISFSDIDYDFDGAMAGSMDQVDFTTTNGLAFGLDVAGIKDQATSDLKSLKALAKGSPGKLKIASKLFLSFHYGWKLLASDAYELADALKESSKRSNRRVHFSVEGETLLSTRAGLTLVSAYGYRNIYYDPYAQIASKTLRLAEAMDVVPDLSNVWDMIPFSFVVDWFTNVGELAEGVDAFYTLVQQHKVLGTITSTKEQYVYRTNKGPGQYNYTIYKRDCRKDWYPIPRFSFQVKNPLTNLYHWIEGGSLVVATRP